MRIPATARLPTPSAPISATVPKLGPPTQQENEVQLPQRDAAPSQPASDTAKPAAKAPTRRLAAKATPKGRKDATPAPASKERLFANPTRPKALRKILPG